MGMTFVKQGFLREGVGHICRGIQWVLFKTAVAQPVMIKVGKKKSDQSYGAQ